MNYFEFYGGDYVRDTADLSLAEHGAYLLLMSSYYSSEKPLQVDYPSLYRICRAMSKAEQAAVTAVANRFFPIGDDKLRHNARADREIAKAQKRISSARQNGEKGGRPPKTPEEPKAEPKQEPKNNPNETQQKPTGFQSGNPVANPLGTPPETHSGEALQTPHATSQAEAFQEIPESTDSGVPAKAETICPQSEIVSLYHEILPSLIRVRDWTNERQALLRKRWRDKRERQSLDWWRTFFEYVSASDFLMGRTTNRNGDSFECDLEWLVRPKNFVKVLEGKYENRRAA